MAKTEFLGLNLTENDPYFEDWRKSIDGNNEEGQESNMQIIDKAIKQIHENGVGGGLGTFVVYFDSTVEEMFTAIEAAENGAIFVLKFAEGQFVPFNVEVDRNGNNVLIGRTSYTHWFADGRSYITIDVEYIIHYDKSNKYIIPETYVNWGNGFVVSTSSTLMEFSTIFDDGTIPIGYLGNVLGSFSSVPTPDVFYIESGNALVKCSGFNQDSLPYFEDVSNNTRTDILFNEDTQSFEFVEHILVNLPNLEIKKYAVTFKNPAGMPFTGRWGYWDNAGNFVREEIPYGQTIMIDRFVLFSNFRMGGEFLWGGEYESDPPDLWGAKEIKPITDLIIKDMWEVE